MIVNAILHQQVPQKNENQAKFSQSRTPQWFLFDKCVLERASPSGIKFRLMSEQQPAGGTPNDPAKRFEPGAVEPSPAESSPVQPNPAETDMFATRPAEGAGVPMMAWVVAGVVVLAVVVALVFAGRHKAGPPANTVLPLAAYAANLPLSQFAMSESTSLSGGKSTFVDGHIHNAGSQTVTGITVQVLFRNDEGMPPQVETLPLALIRTREPYIDTEPVGAAPLRPGDDRDFRLIFESIPENWNVQMPEVRIVQVEAK